MELAPRRENRNAYWLSFQHYTKDKRSSLAELVLAAGCWSQQEESGVLLVNNRISYVDRARDYPMTGYLKLARELAPKAGVDAPVTELPLATALDIARKADPAFLDAWRDVGTYRGI